MAAFTFDFEGLRPFISVPEMAELLGISRAGAYTLANSEGFPSIRIGTRILVPTEDLMRYLEELKT